MRTGKHDYIEIYGQQMVIMNDATLEVKDGVVKLDNSDTTVKFKADRMQYEEVGRDKWARITLEAI